MANSCWFEIRVKGSPKGLKAFANRYEDLNDLGEIFEDEAYIDVYDDEISLSGRCTWSADSAFELERTNCPIRAAARHLDLFIEIFSEQDEYQEHYVIKCGDVVTSEGFNLTRVRKDNYEDFEEFAEVWDTDLTQEDWDKLDDEDEIDVENHFPEGFAFADFSIQEIENYATRIKKDNVEADEDWDDDDEDEDE